MSYRDEYTERAEHECPTALERKVEEFDVGGVFWSPAGRWETITDRTPHAQYSVQVNVTTDRCTWTFWPSDKFPYLDGWRIRPCYVLVNEGHSQLEIVVGGERGFGGRGHVLASAQQIRGTGWQITDRPAGAGELEYVTKPGKAAARSEMNRRARAHGKRLGLPVWSDKSGGAR